MVSRGYLMGIPNTHITITIDILFLNFFILGISHPIFGKKG